MVSRNLRKKRIKRSAKGSRRTVKFLAVAGAFASLCIFGGICLLFLANSWLSNLPRYDNLASYAESGVTTVYANDGETVLAELRLENRIATTYDNISPYVLEGTVATEDERYFEHKGIDPIGIMRAIFVNAASGGKAEGASTITQQLVRNTILLDEMNDISYKRKIREMYLALKVEETYSKEEILTMYLNVINYGNGCYGIETASQEYFGKSAKDLTLSEAALLIGIPQSPTANNPREHYDNAIKRRAVVLQRMLSNGCITQEEYDEVIDDEPELVRSKGRGDTVSELAPYFVDYIKQLLRDSGQFSQEQVSKGGLSIYTTLDVKCQKAANEAIESGVGDSGLDGSLVSIDPSNGDIVAMVGGKDYDESQFNLATQMSRQAGSSFKTFALLAALNEGVDPDNTYINADSPAHVGKNWEVNNSEGDGSGEMSLTSATTSSVNTVYARLVHGLGAQKLVDMAKACGVTADLKAYDSLVLGAQGVSTLDMASGYATIASGGVYHQPVAITSITDSNGNPIYTHQYDEGTRVVSQQVANKATEILMTVVEYGTGTRASLSSIGQQAAGKTGTSQLGRDLWFCGFTPQYATAVWAGYREETETGLYGGSTCGPIWRDYMVNALDGEETVDFDIEDTEIEYQDSSTWDFSGYDN